VSTQDEPTTPGLRGRRRMATELDIEGAALTALGERPFDGLTMDEIAAAAGVSTRTAFRYFPAKVDTVLHTARQIAATLSVALAVSAESASLRATEDAIAAALGVVVESDEAAVTRLRRLRTLMINDARLRAEVAKAEGYLAGLDDARAARPDLERRLLLEIAAATLRAAFDSWAADEHEADTPGAGQRLLEHYRRARDIRESFDRH